MLQLNFDPSQVYKTIIASLRREDTDHDNSVRVHDETAISGTEAKSCAVCAIRKVHCDWKEKIILRYILHTQIQKELEYNLWINAKMEPNLDHFQVTEL